MMTEHVHMLTLAPLSRAHSEQSPSASMTMIHNSNKEEVEYLSATVMAGGQVS